MIRRYMRGKYPVPIVLSALSGRFTSLHFLKYFISCFVDCEGLGNPSFIQGMV
jgi:hypothetical protein